MIGHQELKTACIGATGKGAAVEVLSSLITHVSSRIGPVKKKSDTMSQITLLTLNKLKVIYIHE